MVCWVHSEFSRRITRASLATVGDVGRISGIFLFCGPVTDADVIMAPEEFDLAGETHEEPIAAMECIPVSLCVKVAGAHIAGWRSTVLRWVQISNISGALVYFAPRGPGNEKHLRTCVTCDADRGNGT
ncbi:hypothetical protein F2P81_019601 [Scophthalmus maximus]|uniref:Uncharacterized protein n=1 Tax=Scophthalmus maximus TaxID=52904 RepID=A0A6A4SCA8_SCOMX|nr:hypothetical protein F2P81_019601 [Scophthalmus maximus]